MAFLVGKPELFSIFKNIKINVTCMFLDTILEKSIILCVLSNVITSTIESNPQRNMFPVFISKNESSFHNFFDE